MKRLFATGGYFYICGSGTPSSRCNDSSLRRVFSEAMTRRIMVTETNSRQVSTLLSRPDGTLNLPNICGENGGISTDPGFSEAGVTLLIEGISNSSLIP